MLWGTLLVSKLPRRGASYPPLILSLTNLLRHGYSLNLWNAFFAHPSSPFLPAPQWSGPLLCCIIIMTPLQSIPPFIHFFPWVPCTQRHPRRFLLKQCMAYTIPKMLCEYLNFSVGTHTLRLAFETFCNHFYPMGPTFSLSSIASSWLCIRCSFPVQTFPYLILISDATLLPLHWSVTHPFSKSLWRPSDFRWIYGWKIRCPALL